MRLKYPHIAIGALASSAPILQFEDIVPPQTFYDIVSNSFRVCSSLDFNYRLCDCFALIVRVSHTASLLSTQHESTSCFNTIKESWNALESEGLKNDGLMQLTKTFHFCQ